MSLSGLATLGFLIWAFRNRSKVPVPLFKVVQSLAMLYVHFRGTQSDQLKEISKSLERHLSERNALRKANVISGYAVPSLEHQALRSLLLAFNLNGASAESSIENIRKRSKWLPFYIQAFDHMTLREHFIANEIDKTFKDLKVIKVTTTDGNEHFETGTGSGSSSRGKIIYFIHGGSFIMGKPENYSGTMQKLASKCHVAVYSPEYRLLPEITPMQQQSDVLSGYLYLVNQLHYSPEDIVIVGDDAGGGLALKLLQDTVEMAIKPKAAVLISPMADFTMSGDSYRENLGHDEVFNAPMMRLVKNALEDSVLREAQSGEHLDLSDPRVSPMHGTYKGLPKLYVVASETELLYNDARAIVERSRRAGADVIFESGLYGVHDYPLMGDYAPEYAESFGRICDFIKVMHSNPVNDYPGAVISERDYVNVDVKQSMVDNDKDPSAPGVR